MSGNKAVNVIHLTLKDHDQNAPGKMSRTFFEEKKEVIVPNNDEKRKTQKETCLVPRGVLAVFGSSAKLTERKGACPLRQC